MSKLIALLIGWGMDLLVGDPERWPHPVVWFGRIIAFCERRLNSGSHRRLKGALTATGLIAATFLLTTILRSLITLIPSPFALPPSPFSLHPSSFALLFDVVVIFYCLAGTTLIREVRMVFHAVDRSLAEGRKQVARIVGRDTSELSAQEVRTAALETLAENLSDGVIAPLFWLLLLGTPGMLAYKMVNTLDSMIGYRTERYREFGCWAARIDDVANFIPARLTALLMVVAAAISGRRSETISNPPLDQRSLATKGTQESSPFTFICRYGRCHASPNSGYPEAALAAILDCRFGGPHYYFGELFDKPYIGHNDRPLTTADMKTAVRVNRTAEILMVTLVALFYALIF